LAARALDELKGVRKRMTQEIVRCPYCVQDSEFRPMFPESNKLFVCAGCGHSVVPDDAYAKCPCPRCRRMNTAATRITRERPGLSQTANQ
jgi:hypothetical protein